MNICVVTPLYPVTGRNDIKTDTQAIHLLLKYLTEEHNIQVFNINRISPREIFESKNKSDNLYNPYNYKIDGIEATLLRYMAYPKQRYLTSKQTSVVRETIRQVLDEKDFRPDVYVVHFPTIFPDLFTEAYQNVRKIAILHRSDINIIKVIPKLADNINKHYEAIVGRSKSVNEMAAARGIHVERQIAFSGIPHRFLMEHYNHHFHKFDENISILYVGKLIQRKHPEYILSLCEDLNVRGFPVTATVIGDGSMKKRLEKQLRKLKCKDKVHMVSALTREQVQEKMSYSDIFVLPSVDETLGLVYLEAMAAGCITVGVLGEGIDGIVKNGENGYLIKPENYPDLLTCVLSIINQNLVDIQRISQAAITTANECPEEKASENYFNILQGQIGGTE